MSALPLKGDIMLGTRDTPALLELAIIAPLSSGQFERFFARWASARYPRCPHTNHLSLAERQCRVAGRLNCFSMSWSEFSP